MRGFRRPAALALCLACLALSVLGCARQTGQMLPQWTLEVPGAAPRTIEIPARLESLLPYERLVYRLKTTVTLDGALVGRDVELVVPYLPAFASVYADGQAARLVSDPGPAAAYGGSAPRRWLLPAAATAGGAPVALEIDVSHRWTRSARLDSVPELVAAGAPAPLADRNGWLNQQGAWFGLIALSEVGMTFLAIYFWDRRQRAYLWFAIQALTASYYPAYVAGLPAPWLGWALENMLLTQSLAVAPIVSVYFTHAFFGLRPPSRAWLVLLALAMLSPVVPLGHIIRSGSDFLIISYSAVFVVACVLSATLYQLAMGVRLLRDYADRGTVVFFICCWVALGGSCWVDLLAWAGGPDLLAGGRPACVGLGFFGIFQSMLLGRSHVLSLVDADRLNERLRRQVEDLEARQHEIESLNEELRRQVGRRTGDILAALMDSERTPVKSLEPGDTIDARYRVVAALGAGGMGAVFEVERLNDGRHFALKMAQEVRGMALARLAREARIATQVHHPNVVSVVDADVAEGGYAYIVMELVEGRTLANLGKERGGAWRLAVLLQVLQGVKALHAQGIIHRDLKPSNILISDDEGGRPRVKITDFGISRWLESEPLDGFSSRPPPPESQAATRTETPTRAEGPTGDPVRSAADGPTVAEPRSGPLRDPRSTPQLTRPGRISGTPAYVAPELAGGTAHLSPAVDIFSFGVVAYDLLTGAPPYAEAPFLARLEGRDVPPPAPVSSLKPDLGRDLAHALDACLAPTPDARPDVDDLIVAVQKELTREASLLERGPEPVHAPTGGVS
jgi:serine/threonine-protein kinase